MADQSTSVIGSQQWELALRLQEALLRLDLCAREIPKSGSSQAPEQEVASSLREVFSAFRDLREHGNAGLRGIPAWLGPGENAAVSGTGHPAGLRLLRERLASSTPIWKQISDFLSARPDGFLMNTLEHQWRTLSHTIPGPGEEAAKTPERDVDPGIRVVFPTVHTASGNGFLVEMLLYPRAQADRGDTKHKQTDSFKRGLAVGRQAALELAESIGVPQEVLEPWKDCHRVFHGIPPPMGLRDTSASVATAVALIRHWLDLPANDRLVTGDMGADGVMGNLPNEAHLAAKQQAASDHGLTLLPLESGWKLPAVCRLLWPESWDSIVARTAQKSLRDHGHEVCVVTDVQTEATPDEWDFLPVHLDVAENILLRMNAGAPAVVVGGPRSSARSTAARQAALQWGQARQAPVIEVRLKDGMLPERTELEQVITLARHAADIHPDAQAAVILEDLLPYEGAVDLDAVLPPTAERTVSTIIAVCLYSGGIRWKTDEVATVPSLHRSKDLRAFTEEFAQHNGLNLDHSQLALARRASGGDLWWLVRLLLHKQLPSPVPEADLNEAPTTAALTMASSKPTETGGAQEQYGGADALATVLKAYARRMRREVAPGSLKQIRAVAAASLLRIAVPETLLGTVPESMLRKAGAQRDHMGRWYFARRITCHALLATQEGVTDPTGREWIVEAQYKALYELLQPRLNTYDPMVTRFITVVLTAAKAVEPGLHSRLLRLVTAALSRIEESAPPVLVAYALLASGSEGPDGGRHLFDTLIGSLYAAGWRAMTARQATTCLRAIRSYRDFTDSAVHPVHQKEVLDQIAPSMKEVLTRTDPVQGLLFIHELGQLWDERTMDQIIPLAVATTKKCDASRVEHYEAAVRLIDAALRYSDDRGAALESFAKAPGVRRLVKADTRHDAGLILARAALRMMLGLPADEVTDNPTRLGAVVTAALRKSKPVNMTSGLMLIEQVDVRVARLIVQASAIDDWLRRLLLEAQYTPWQAAKLIRALGKVDFRSILSVLYTGKGSAADPKVITALTECVIRMGDLKGVGHVVSAVTSVDAVWGPGGLDSAAAQLCAQLRGFIDAALEDETRGSVVHAVVTALVGADIPQEDLHSLVERCVDVVATEAERNQKDQAPRLALLLGRHEAVGPEFLSLLDSRLSDQLLFDRMTHSPSVETRAAYMDLARALRRTTNDQFRTRFLSLDWLEDSKTVLRVGNVVNSLKGMRAYTRLLRDTGTVAFSKEKVVRAVDNDPQWWAKRLKRLYHPAQWSEALHLLHHLAPGMAADSLRQLDILFRPEAAYGGVRRTAPAHMAKTARENKAPIPSGPSPARVAEQQQRKLFRGLLAMANQRFVQPDDVVKLVHAVRTINEGAGHGMGAALSANKRWERRVRPLLETDSPVYFGDQLRLMAENHLDLPTSLRDRLFRKWNAQAYDYRSPAVVQSLVRGFAAWGPEGAQLAEQLVGNLNLERIALRIGRGLPRDMTMASALIRTLDVWGPEGSAEQIAISIPPNALALVDVVSAVELLQALLDACPHKIANHLQASVEAISVQSQLHYVPDPEVHWRELGWLIRTTGAAGGDVPDSDALHDRVNADCPCPEIIAWVTGCLGQFPPPSSWFPDDVSPPPWAEAARLLVHSELAPPDHPLPGELGTILRRVSLRWQIHLLRRAARDPALRRTLTDDDLIRMRFLGNRHLSVGRPSGDALLQAVDVLTPRHSEGAEVHLSTPPASDSDDVR
ncbi:hypothetical protein AB0K80_19625 [Streptomyces sp. NPDC052682]|uniref:hypothetical protein n=1 Tax=Streptomyces sp. NPDC052682 TaxID=3154954 RepID=UPI003447DF40